MKSEYGVYFVEARMSDVGANSTSSQLHFGAKMLDSTSRYYRDLWATKPKLKFPGVEQYFEGPSSMKQHAVDAKTTLSLKDQKRLFILTCDEFHQLTTTHAADMSFKNEDNDSQFEINRFYKVLAQCILGLNLIRRNMYETFPTMLFVLNVKVLVRSWTRTSAKAEEISGISAVLFSHMHKFYDRQRHPGACWYHYLHSHM